MPVTAAELLAPAGDLLPEMFPGEESATIATRLDAYLAEGADAASAIADPAVHDKAVRLWAYYRAYAAIYVRLSHSPATVQVDGEAQVNRLITQIQNFADLRDSALAAFGTLLASPSGSGGATRRVPVSDTTELAVGW